MTYRETTNLNLTLRLAPVAETVTVVGETPLIPTTSSSVGQVVDLTRIERLPLNGRQFANLAATVPGVGLGFHSDPTKATEYSPQISGGNGRNINYVVDGGDNNDDTIGGLAQLFPLEGDPAVQPPHAALRRAVRPRYGGVLNVVTKSGTNNVHGSALTFFRDTALNARTMTEELNRTAACGRRQPQLPGQAGISPLPVRRQPRRSDRARQALLLRGVRTNAAGYEADRQHPRTVPVGRWRVPGSGARKPVHGQGHREPPRTATTSRSVTGTMATRRRAERDCAPRIRPGRRAPTSSIRSMRATTGCLAERS